MHHRGHRDHGGLEDEAADTVFQQSYIEIDNEADTVTCQFHVRQHLCGMDRVEAFDGFDLDDDARFHDQVDPVAAVEANVLVNHGNLPLAFEPDPSPPQFVGGTRLVRGLEQAGSEFAMHLDRRADDPLRQIEHSVLSVLSVVIKSVRYVVRVECLNVSFPFLPVPNADGDRCDPIGGDAGGR